MLTNYKLYVDLDGVLVAFGKKVLEIYPEFVEGQTERDKKSDSKMWSRIGYYQKQGGRFWYDCDLMDDAQELFDYVKQFNMEILTACGNASFGAGQQKIEWVAKYFGTDVKVNLVEKSKDKAAYATPTTILIDDKMKSIEPFRAAGGIGILHTSAQDTIQQLAAL
jgi:5'(3')-deoxyribonucleotidase